MECDYNKPGSSEGLLEIGLGFDANSGVSKTRVEKSDMEKLGKKKRSAEIKSGFDSDDDEPIGSMFKVKNRRSPKKVKVENDVCEDQELGGMDDTLATFRKKIKGPKVSRASATKGRDLNTDLKEPVDQSSIGAVTNADLASKSVPNTMTKEQIPSEDGIIVKKGSKDSGKEKNKRPKDKLTKKKGSGGTKPDENLTENCSGDHLEDSLSVLLQKARKSSKHNQVKSTQPHKDGDQNPDDSVHESDTIPAIAVGKSQNDGSTLGILEDKVPVSLPECSKLSPKNQRLEEDKKSTDHRSKDPTGNNGFKDDSNHSVIAKLAHDLSEIEVHKEKMEPSSPIHECLPIVESIDRLDDGQHQIQGTSMEDTENVSVSSQKENTSASNGRLSPVSLGECNEETPSIATDQNESDNETKGNHQTIGRRIVRQAKRYRHDDMAYEGDADWEILIHEQSFLVNIQDGGDKGQSVKTKGKQDFFMDAESGGTAAVSVGLKARAAGPVEKIKFKELLKRKGGLQEYIDCRNHILHLWNKDVTRLLPLSECGISDEHPQASLVRDIYSFLDQYGYINFGVASKKEISEANVKHNFKLSGEDHNGRKPGAPVTDLEDGVSFILGRNKTYDMLTDEKGDEDNATKDAFLKEDKDADVSPMAMKCEDKGADVAPMVEEPTVCIQCDLETKRKIIVIGAGPAGLTAARHLQRQGFHVTILEARGRIGGRVFTDYSSLSVPVDLGASIITGVEADVTSQRRPDPSSLICAQLGLELTVLNSDCPLYDTVTGQKVPTDLDEALEAEYNGLLDDMSYVVAQKGDQAMRMSLEEGLEYGLKVRRSENNKYGEKDEILNPLERRVMDWHLAHLEYGCAASLQDVSLPYWNQDDIYGGFGGAHCMIKGGYGAIVDSLKDGLHIHLNHMVTDVCYQTEKDASQKKVKVLTENGKEFSGDAVLITVPLGCLKRETINFSPKLPEWKHSSIQKLGFGVLNKVILEFPEVFWDDSVDYFGATAEETDQRGWCFMFWNVKKTVNAPVLIALVVGKAAVNRQDLTPSDHVNHALATLRKLFGETKVQDPVASVVTDWGRDPFSYGAYSYVAVGASGEDYDTLGKPINNSLFFAGEATCKEHPDTVGGAMMSGLREAVRIVDLLTTGNDFVSEVEAIAAAKRHSDSERSEVRDIIRRLDAIDLTNVHKNEGVMTKEGLLQNMFLNAKSRAGRLHLAKELLNLPSDLLKSFAGTKVGLGILNSWILDSMGKNGTQLLRHCVRLLVLVSTDLLAVRLSGIGKTVKEKVCVHTSRDIRAIASQLVSVWVEIFRKEKASNGGLKLLRQSNAADASRSKSLASGKPPLRAHPTSSENRAVKGGSNPLSANPNNRKGNSGAVTKPENKPSSSQGSAGRQNCKEEDDKDFPMSEEEQAAFDAAEAARAAAIAAAEAYASSGAKCNTPLPLPKIPSFHKFARREQYAQMDDSEFRKKLAGGNIGRQDSISEIDSRNCRVRDWSVDFSATGVNLPDNRSHHSNENPCQVSSYREHSGESGGVDSNIFTKAWVDSAGSEGIKDHNAIERWQSQAAAADSEYFHRGGIHAMDEEDSNMKLANESSASQVTVNRELVGNQPRGVDNIKQAVVDYVASLLMPLYKARKIDKEGYKSIMKKTATKVMEQTTDAEKAMAVFKFLDFKRKNKIRAFVDKLIERHMAMKTDTKSGRS